MTSLQFEFIHTPPRDARWSSLRLLDRHAVLRILSDHVLPSEATQCGSYEAAVHCTEYLAVPVERDEPVGHFMQHCPARKPAWIEVNDPIPCPVRAVPMNVRGCIY